MKKCYLASCGSYSDYHVAAVFSTKEKAEKFIQNSENEYQVEERSFDCFDNAPRKVISVVIHLNDGKVDLYPQIIPEETLTSLPYV